MAAIEDIKVLVVDDSITVRELLKQQLAELGVTQITEARNGRDAVSRYEQWHPDLVFLDINMPEMNGIDALREIMKNNTEAFVVILSSLGTKEKVNETLEIGARNFLMKPVENESLEAILNEITGQTSG